jgi:tripartite-type tricarboxylate transporter receptor subunit TctC
MTALTRRIVLASLTTFVALPAYADTDWPNRPITLVHGFAAGGPTDTVARIMAEGLTTRLGQRVVVDPRPSSRDEFKTRIVADVDKWTGVVAAAHIERI